MVSEFVFYSILIVVNENFKRYYGRKTTPRTDEILKGNSKINPRKTSTDLRLDLLDYDVESGVVGLALALYAQVCGGFSWYNKSTASMCDEAHFWLNGYVNKQNCRIWSEANPQVYVETPLHPEKLTVWCALWAGGIIGPYFFKNDEGHNVTVNGDR
ncbi:hypothetical protein TNCV_3734121 [Trichonephila clavipes]|nr:hypothetical protein TNCV_3734121 [Trichonephila clavipes]